MFFEITLISGLKLRHLLNIPDKQWSQYFNPLISKTLVTIAPILLHPESRGTIRLKSNNPLDQPRIDPAYLTNKQDIKVLISGLRFVEKLVNTEAMQSIGAKIVDKKFPGCELLEFKSDDYWECYIRHLTMTVYHPVGTCKMGLKNDPTTVVDFSLKVHNTNKLRIADTSIFPYLPSGNTNAVAAMVGEQVVDQIKMNDYLLNGYCKITDFFLPIM